MTVTGRARTAAQTPWAARAAAGTWWEFVVADALEEEAVAGHRVIDPGPGQHQAVDATEGGDQDRRRHRVPGRPARVRPPSPRSPRGPAGRAGSRQMAARPGRPGWPASRARRRWSVPRNRALGKVRPGSRVSPPVKVTLFQADCENKGPIMARPSRKTSAGAPSTGSRPS